MVKILEGRKIAKEICNYVAQEIKQTKIKPGLAVILIGSNPASQTYVALKERRCKEVGIHFEKCLFFHTEEQGKIVDKILELNTNPDIHAILVQLPLPPRFDENEIIKTINPQKDVDGFHPDNIERAIRNENTHPKPVLIQAILRLLKETMEPLENKSVTIVANSDIFMKSLNAALENIGMHVECTGPKQSDLYTKTQSADVIIVATGQPWSITPNMLKHGVIAIDVGTTPSKQTGELLGDVHPRVAEVASWLTPVPGGVGPVTVAMLLKNTLILCQQQTNN